MGGAHVCWGWIFTLWLAWARLKPRLPRTALQQSYSRALEMHMFGDRWSRGAWRDCQRWASHLPLARHRATDGRGLHSGIIIIKKEESVWNPARLSPLWPSGEREPGNRPEKSNRQTGWRGERCGWYLRSAAQMRTHVFRCRNRISLTRSPHLTSTKVVPFPQRKKADKKPFCAHCVI